jgi:hypothetical protein
VAVTGATLSAGQVLYTPPATGSANFSYTVADSLGQSASSAVTVTVDSGPILTSRAPAYVAASVATTVGTATAGLAGDALSLVTLTAPSHGALTLNSGQIVFQSSGTVPAGGETDAFSYEVKDQYGDVSAAATATVTLDAGPSAKAGTLTVGHSQSGLNETAYVDTLFAAGAAGDGTAITAVSGATLSAGQVLYTPPATGSANFNYTVADSLGQSVSSTVTVTVDPGPTLTPTSAASIGADKLAKGGTEVLGTVAPGIVGDTLTLSYTSSQGGVVSLNAQDQIVYTAPASIKSATPDAVNYTVADQFGDKVAGSASIVLDPGPAAGGGQITVNQGASVNETAYLLGLVTPGLAGDSETITAVSGANVKLANGVVTYTAPTSATDSFTYTVQDQLGDTSTGNVTVAVNLSPTISGTSAGQPTTNGKAMSPFAGVKIADPVSGATETLTITLSGGGTLADGTGYSGLTNSGAGVYGLKGSAAAATKELDALVFTPASASPNTVNTTGFTLQDVNSVGATATDSTTTVVNTDPAVAPSVSGTIAGQVFGVASPDQPFSKLTITDANANTTDTVVIGVTGGGALSGAGLSTTSTPGVYQLAATSAANATKELDALVYTPVASPTHAAETITFAVNDVTSASTVANGPTTTITINPGPSAGAVAATVAYGTAVNLTSAVVAAATPGLRGDTLTITADNASGTAGGVSLVNGQLVYTATGAALAHIPANGQQSDSFGFTISDEYGDTATGVAKITVSNPADVVNGSLLGLATIEGASGADVINAYGWFNTIFDNGGNDLVNAGLGNATVYTSTGDVVVNLNGYYDTVSGGNGWDTVSGSQGNTTVTLGNGDDNVSTGGYSNTITLGNGTDTVNAGLGSAAVVLGGGADTIVAAGYSNSIQAGNGNDSVTGGAGLETILLGSGNDVVNASGYSNTITVGSGTNTIVAGAGLDQVTAGAGVDTITLAGYTDTVTLNGSTATVSAAQGSETIIANGGHDTLAFSGYGDLAELGGTLSASVADAGSGLRIDVGASTETLSLTGFGTADATGVIDLLNGAGGYKSAAAILGALHTDGHGGTSLSLGTSGSIDFVNTTAAQLHSSNFAIG